LVHRLTDTPSTEPGHAGRTLLYDLDEDRWDDALCQSFGVPRAALPALLPSAGARGVLRGEPWRGTPLDGVPLVALVGDQQAALVGNGGQGVRSNGERVAVVHFGTGAFALVETGAAPLRHNGLLAAVAWSPRGAGDPPDAPPQRRLHLQGAGKS